MMHTKISVIIPTYNSKEELEKTLNALIIQSLSLCQYEVIVVDDGSNDGTDLVIQAYNEKLDISYYYMEDMGFRLAAARNIGIKAAKYSLVLFIDCGIIASENLLKYHVESHTDNSKKITLGLSYGVEEFSMKNSKSLSNLIENNGLETIFHQLNKTSQFNDCRFGALAKIDFDLSKLQFPWVICWGGNMSCEKDVLNEISGFDEWFKKWGGEDVDLAIRLFEIGCDFQVINTHEALHLPHFRCEKSNQKSALDNINYIINKSDTAGVNLLSKLSWEEIINVACNEAS
jgi:glycosyltransferase involved in cell wall biosynthesis